MPLPCLSSSYVLVQQICVLGLRGSGWIRSCTKLMNDIRIYEFHSVPLKSRFSIIICSSQFWRDPSDHHNYVQLAYEQNAILCSKTSRTEYVQVFEL